MDLLVDVVVGLVVGLIGVAIWEGLGLRDQFLRLANQRRRRRTWDQFFNVDGEVVLFTSLVMSLDGKETSRVSDEKAVERLLPRLKRSHVTVSRDGPPMALPHLSHHYIVLGSTMYSTAARSLVDYFELPYQYTFDYLQGDPPREVLKLVTQYGQEYLSSKDSGCTADGRGVDYGVLLLATMNGKRVYWFSGIHGIGTIGVAKYVLQNPDEFLADLPTSREWARQWLIRIFFDPAKPESFDAVSHLEIVDKPRDCAPRPQNRRVKAVISDLGNVLMAFDRDRTYRALAHLTGRAYRDIDRLIEQDGCRDAYERGDLSDDEFFDRICSLLGVSLDRTAFEEWWGDIFWENRNVSELYGVLRQQIPLVLLSNTSRMHFDSVSEHYRDVIGLFRAHVLSFKERCAKPDPEIFLRAVRAAGPEVHPQDCVYIDDIAEYVEVAKDLGMRAYLYHSFPALVRDLRSVGFKIHRLKSV